VRAALTRDLAPAKCPFGASAFPAETVVSTASKCCGLRSQSAGGEDALSAVHHALDAVAIRAAPVFHIDTNT
jgi:hypothetical protein